MKSPSLARLNLLSGFMTKIEDLRNTICTDKKTLDLEHINTLAEQTFTGFSLDRDLLRTLTNALPEIKKPKISVLHFSAKSTTIVQKLIQKYQDQCHFLDITVLFDSQEELDICQLIGKQHLPTHGLMQIKYKLGKILSEEVYKKYDLIIGIPENKKVYAKEKAGLCDQFKDPTANNLISFITSKCLDSARHIALILPKYFLHSAEYHNARKLLAAVEVSTIIDYGEHGLVGSYTETMALIANSQGSPNSTRVISFANKTRISQIQSEITDPRFPTWIVYTNDFFKMVANKLEFDQLKVYRDRAISSRLTCENGNIRVLNAKNIPRHTRKVIKTPNDVYVNEIDVVQTEAYKYLNRPNVYLCPNLTNHPRLIEKPINTIASGSLAVFSCKNNKPLTETQLEYFSSGEFEAFYKIARNHCTRSLNIDKNAAFYFGLLKEEKPL